MPRFFVSGSLGFEENLISELQSIWFLLADLDGLPTRSAFPEMTIIDGGVEFDCELHLGLQLNYFSKQAYRVLFRVGKFPARFYDQLEKQLAQINWASFLKSDSSLHFKVSFFKSRINNEKNVLEACENVFRRKGFKVSKDAEQTVYLRIAKDNVEVSLDSTGEHLHFRGYREQQGEAPIRENLAALLWSFMPEQPGSKDVIVDPFCGSGTLLFEYLIKGLPNFSRSYAFTSWLNCPAIMKSPTFSKNFRWIEPVQPDSQIILGCDVSGETLQKAEKNQELVHQHYGVKVGVRWILSRCRDLQIPQAEQLFIVANPPYGERLDDRGAMEDLDLCISKNADAFRRIHVLVLQPLGRVPEFKKMNLKNKFPFSNQGLKLNLLHYTEKS